ncbi:cytochrome b-c1 complex subunit 10-like [Drosophila tropicalis]|uniref:cytochrome b-c1 complex subunit 10-like n=1 Tax=Drosophila tropicalis TaxID=46794 RepID=UPI0035ABC99A
MGIKDMFLYLYCQHRPSKGQTQLVKSFAPSVAYFGLAGLLTLVYYTEWKVITEWIPIYNTKYPKPDAEASKK